MFLLWKFLFLIYLCEYWAFIVFFHLYKLLVHVAICFRLLAVFLIDTSLCLISLLITLRSIFWWLVECNIVENASNSHRVGQCARYSIFLIRVGILRPLAQFLILLSWHLLEVYISLVLLLWKVYIDGPFRRHPPTLFWLEHIASSFDSLFSQCLADVSSKRCELNQAILLLLRQKCLLLGSLSSSFLFILRHLDNFNYFCFVLGFEPL